MPSIAKIPPILLTCAFYHASQRPPGVSANMTTEEQQNASKDSKVPFGERVIPYTAPIETILYWAFDLTEVASIVALRFPGHPISRRIIQFLDMYTLSGREASRLGHTYIFHLPPGFLPHYHRCSHSFSLLPGTCPSLQLSLRKNHELITTGPSSRTTPCLHGWVQNMRRTIHDIRGGRFMDIGWETWLGKSYMLGVLSSGMWKVRCYSRGRMEDEYLRREFKERWEEWAKSLVKYRYPPGIC